MPVSHSDTTHRILDMRYTQYHSVKAHRGETLMHTTHPVHLFLEKSEKSTMNVVVTTLFFGTVLSTLQCYKMIVNVTTSFCVTQILSNQR